ncbi:MAG: FliA/WhiG family RNA polymerase sigma factor [Deltaproteobacteria bacterium]|nr:FliA/WhiG family RNA polymerase sigma factor [Deltaproteobacteria bacterium]
MTTDPVNKDPELRETLTKEYLPLIRRTAARLAHKAPPSITTEDLVSAGMLGLVEAASRFDPTRAAHFRAFAEARVHGAMIDEMRSQGPLSRDLRVKSSRLTKAIRDLEHELGRQPIETEIASRMELDVEKYYSLLVQLQPSTVLSPAIIEQTVCPPHGFPERIPGNPQDDYLFGELRDRLARAIARLSDREQRVLAMYYRDDLSLKEIGERFGVTESRVCQIRSQAVHRLHAMLEEEDHG